MLIYIGSRRQTYVLRTMQRDERMPQWVCRTYSWLFRARRLPAATYIFTGVDRLDAGERRLAALFYRHLNAQGPGFRALNDPAIAMGRYRLLRTLHEMGFNDFNVFLASERDRPTHYPVYVRRNSVASLPLTALVESAAELERELDRLVASGEVAEDLIITEYHTEAYRPDLYRKFGMFRCGDRFAPRAPLYGSTWYVKNNPQAEATDDDHRKDAELLATNPHRRQLRDVFDIAGIEYGRADYNIVGGRLQVYEINFNPDLRSQRDRPAHPNPLRDTNLHRTDDLGFEVLSALDNAGTGHVGTISNSDLVQFRLRFWRNYAPQRY